MENGEEEEDEANRGLSPWQLDFARSLAVDKIVPRRLLRIVFMGTPWWELRCVPDSQTGQKGSVEKHRLDRIILPDLLRCRDDNGAVRFSEIDDLTQVIISRLVEIQAKLAGESWNMTSLQDLLAVHLFLIPALCNAWQVAKGPSAEDCTHAIWNLLVLLLGHVGIEIFAGREASTEDLGCCALCSYPTKWFRTSPKLLPHMPTDAAVVAIATAAIAATFRAIHWVVLFLQQYQGKCSVCHFCHKPFSGAAISRNILDAIGTDLYGLHPIVTPAVFCTTLSMLRCCQYSGMPALPPSAREIVANHLALALHGNKVLACNPFLWASDDSANWDFSDPAEAKIGTRVSPDDGLQTMQHIQEITGYHLTMHILYGCCCRSNRDLLTGLWRGCLSSFPFNGEGVMKSRFGPSAAEDLLRLAFQLDRHRSREPLLPRVDRLMFLEHYIGGRLDKIRECLEKAAVCPLSDIVTTVIDACQQQMLPPPVTASDFSKREIILKLTQLLLGQPVFLGALTLRLFDIYAALADPLFVPHDVATAAFFEGYQRATADHFDSNRDNRPVDDGTECGAKKLQSLQPDANLTFDLLVRRLTRRSKDLEKWLLESERSVFDENRTLILKRLSLLQLTQLKVDGAQEERLHSFIATVGPSWSEQESDYILQTYVIHHSKEAFARVLTTLLHATQEATGKSTLGIRVITFLSINLVEENYVPPPLCIKRQETHLSKTLPSAPPLKKIMSALDVCFVIAQESPNLLPPNTLMSAKRLLPGPVHIPLLFGRILLITAIRFREYRTSLYQNVIAPLLAECEPWKDAMLWRGVTSTVSRLWISFFEEGAVSEKAARDESESLVTLLSNKVPPEMIETILAETQQTAAAAAEHLRIALHCPPS